MSEKQKKIVHLIYGITLSLLIVVVAICLTVACVMIAKKAPSGAFTKDAIYSAFLVVIAPFSVCVLGIIGGGVLHAVFPAKEEIRASVPSKYILKKLYRKVNLNEAPPELSKFVKSQRRFRLAFFIIMILNFVANLAACIIYLCTSSVFKGICAGEISDIYTILPECARIMSYSIVPFVVMAVYEIFSKFTYDKELEAVRAIIAERTKRGHPVSEMPLKEEKVCPLKKHRNKFIWAIRIIVTVIAVGLIITGICLGDLDKILIIANNICLGCIGIG